MYFIIPFLHSNLLLKTQKPLFLEHYAITMAAFPVLEALC